MIWGSRWSKSRLAKAAGAEPSGQMRNGTLHAVVARSTFPSPNVQNTPRPDHKCSDPQKNRKLWISPDSVYIYIYLSLLSNPIPIPIIVKNNFWYMFLVVQFKSPLGLVSLLYELRTLQLHLTCGRLIQPLRPGWVFTASVRHQVWQWDISHHL